MSTATTRALAEAATAIAEGLTEPIATAVPPASERSTPQSLAHGAAGIALLHIERARAGLGDWSTVHGWLAAAASGELTAGPYASLFFGAPAVAFVCHTAAENSNRYARARADLHTATTALTHARLHQAHTRIERGERPALAEFDLIRGLTGLGAYHLRADPTQQATRAVLSYLVRLSEPLPGEADGLPGWWTEHGPTAGQAMPGGHGNFGMAHGITGPLALLSLALRAGVVVDGHIDAISRICAWLDTWRQDHQNGSWWPPTLTRDECHSGKVAQAGPGQPSWCYGTPGLARAQQLAALATGDTARQQHAEAALLGCLDDSGQLDQITDIGLCHGSAGLIHTTRCMATNASTCDIAARLPRLAPRLLAQLHRAPPSVGLLDGRSGAALAIHAAANTAPLRGWDRCLLLT